MSSGWKGMLFARRITPTLIALMGMLVGVHVLTNTFLQINLGVLQVGIEYVFFALYGLILGPVIGAIVGLFGDTLALLLKGIIGQWMYEYAIIPIMIAVLASLVKYFLFDKSRKRWFFSVITIFLITDALALVTIFLNSFFNGYDFNGQSLLGNIIIWLSCSFLVLLQVVLLTLYLKTNSYKVVRIINTLTLMLLVSVVVSWLWGPFAFLAWWNRFGPGEATLEDNYVLFLIPRILKTPLQVIIWSFLLHFAYETTALLYQQIVDNRWK